MSEPKSLYDSIGALIDAWETLPNDLKSDLRHTSPSFTKAIESIIGAMEFYGSFSPAAAYSVKCDKCGVTFGDNESECGSKKPDGSATCGSCKGKP